MKLPIVALVGRPNVGKSTIFNKIVGSKISIIEDTPGVTRDRIYSEGKFGDYRFNVIDTGGIRPGDEDEIMVSIYDQARIACEEAEKDRDYDLEQENCVEFLRGAKTATVTFTQGRFISKIYKLKEKYPDRIEIVAENKNRDGKCQLSARLCPLRAASKDSRSRQYHRHLRRWPGRFYG